VDDVKAASATAKLISVAVVHAH